MSEGAKECGDRAVFDFEEIRQKLASGEWVLAPKTPSHAMIEAAEEIAWGEDLCGIWRTMIGAI